MFSKHLSDRQKHLIHVLKVAHHTFFKSCIIERLFSRYFSIYRIFTHPAPGLRIVKTAHVTTSLSVAAPSPSTAPISWCRRDGICHLHLTWCTYLTRTCCSAGTGARSNRSRPIRQTADDSAAGVPWSPAPVEIVVWAAASFCCDCAQFPNVYSWTFLKKTRVAQPE